MKENQIKLLNRFDQPLRKHIINFCNSISSQDYTVYILLARKAACLIDILIETELIQINGEVVTDRILEYNSEWLLDQKVVIIDDTIISGTSIYKLIDKLKKYNPSEINVHAFCINDYWFVDEMLEDEHGNSYLREPFLRLNHTSSLRFCKHIVESLSISPRPYNVDFPIYENIKLSINNLKRIVNSPDWKIINTTTKIQSENDVICLTVNPSKEFVNSFNNSIGWKLSESAHLKLRVYSKKLTDLQRNTTYITKVVPFIMFNPIKIENVTYLIDRICEAEKVDSEFIIKELITETSKLLFVQYYFSERLFKAWLKILEINLEKSIKFQISRRSQLFLFSPKIVRFLNDLNYEKKLCVTSKSHLFQSENFEFDKTIEFYNPTGTLNKIIKPFLDFYYKRELPARRIVKNVKKNAFEDVRYNAIVNRLDDGISIYQLKKIISETVNNLTDTNLIISLFLDNYIDNGIVVPITVYKKGLLYRGFRHGEEIVWGNYNNKLLSRFFKKYLAVNDAKEITQTVFQKLIVLFLKIGVRKGFLEEYSSLTPSKLKIKLLGVRAHLFGLVTEYNEVDPLEPVNYATIIDQDKKSYWMSEFLKDMDMLNFNKNKNIEFDFAKFDGTYEKEKEEGEPSDIDDLDIDDVNEIAEIFGSLRKEKILNEKDLVLLTSCTNLHDNTASLAAELQLFNRNYISYKNRINSNIRNSSFTLSRLKDLRDKNINYLWTAINSGQNKYIDFKQNNGIKLINRITEIFSNQKDTFKERAWKRYWIPEIELSKNEKNELNLLNEKMGSYLLNACVIATIIQSLIFELLRRGKHLDSFTQNLQQENANITANLKTIKSQIKAFNIEDESEQSKRNETLIAVLEVEKKLLINKRNRNNKANNYWKDYTTKNKEFVLNLHKSLTNNNLENNCTELISYFVTELYFEDKNKVLTQKINGSFKILDAINFDIKLILEEYKQIVPQWGKLQEKVKYKSIIHINSCETDSRIRTKISDLIKLCLSDFELEEFGEHATRKTISLLRFNGAKSGDGYIIGGRGQFYLERMVKLSLKILTLFLEQNIDIFLSLLPLDENNNLDAYFNQQTNNFDSVQENIVQKVIKNNHANSIFINNQFNKNQTFNFQEILMKYDQPFSQNELKEIESSNLDYRDFLVNVNNLKEMKKKIIGVITALPKELAAMKLMLDYVDHSIANDINDGNDYVTGYIEAIDGCKIKVIIALLKEMGTNNAATTTTNMLRSFEDIDDIIVCGIAGGIPNIEEPSEHVRLGDIVISDKNGILQYDNIKETDTDIKIRDNSPKPSAKLLGKINMLISEFESNNSPWINYIDKYQGHLRNSNRPSTSCDILKINGQITEHPLDNERMEGKSRVHHGPIGSSNTLLKNESKRDYLRDEYKIKAIEMETSGIADGTWTLSKGYIAVRGIVDYCNNDKNDQWHNYSAICAACYTKCIIERL